MGAGLVTMGMDVSRDTDYIFVVCKGGVTRGPSGLYPPNSFDPENSGCD